MQKTLGGNRLGSGKKMKVELHNYERSTHDKGYVWRSTMSAGTLVPFIKELALPGDTFDINLDCDVKTHPTVGPLFGSYKVQLDVFLAPIRLYHSALHNNKLGVGRQMSAVKLPQIRLTAEVMDTSSVTDINNAQINPSCILNYLGIKGIGLVESATPGNTAERDFCAVPWLAYWEIYKNYYANKQEEIGAVIHTPSVGIIASITEVRNNATQDVLPEDPGTTSMPITIGDALEFTWAAQEPIITQVLIQTNQGIKTVQEIFTNWSDLTGTIKITDPYDGRFGDLTLVRWRMQAQGDITIEQPAVVTFPLEHIDEMRENILATNNTATFIITESADEPYGWVIDRPGGTPNALSSQEGLALKTYQSDLFNNWLKTENIEAISTATAIDTSGGSFTIDQLVISKKVWNMLNRINVSGGSYDDWIDAVYVHDRYTRVESPMYMGGLIKELVFQEVVSNSESESGQPLGTLAGKGVLSKKHKGGTVVIKVDEPSYIIGIVSLTPRIDYSQGNDWDVNLKTMDDLHKPALDEIGFQELITEQMAWWETHNDIDGTDGWIQQSAGKQPAWLNYMTAVNRTYGNFAIPDNEMFMTLNRRYETEILAGNQLAQIKDLTTYIDPSKFNFIFAQTSLDAQNFWTQIAVDITARRKMSAKLMPNL